MGRRSPNSHELKMRAFPFTAQLRREEPGRLERCRRPDHRRARPLVFVGSAKGADADCKPIGFVTQAEAEAMQHWIAESEIEARPAPPLTMARCWVSPVPSRPDGRPLAVPPRHAADAADNPEGRLLHRLPALQALRSGVSRARGSGSVLRSLPLRLQSMRRPSRNRHGRTGGIHADGAAGGQASSHRLHKGFIL